MKRQTTVLVVGAGPCGLAMAAQLRRLGVDVTIVDAETQAHSGSRAILLWPPVQEVLAELGIADRARGESIRPAALLYHLGGGPTVPVPLSAENTPLVLPQERTGHLLADALAGYGVKVEWGVRVTRVVPAANLVRVAATDIDGTDWEIEADWVIGADGLRSHVREQLGIEFDGARFPAGFLLAEGTLDGAVSREQVHYFLADSGVVLVAPLPSGDFRVSGAVPEGTAPTAEEAQKLLDARGPGGLRFTDVRTVSLFSSDERIAATLRSGRCFLVGDAAHVHSPIGGQGLNLGIPDTRNLAWKLAGVIQGRLRESVLDSYDPERRAAIEQTLRATARMARQAVIGPVGRVVRNVTWWLLQVSGGLTRVYAPMLAGWRSKYPAALLAAAPAAGFRPRPQTRDPKWIPDPDPAFAGRFQLITTGAATAPLAAAAAALAARLPGLVAHLPRDGGQEQFVLLRPDGYLAASGPAARLDGVAAALAALAPDHVIAPTPDPISTEHKD